MVAVRDVPVLVLVPIFAGGCGGGCWCQKERVKLRRIAGPANCVEQHLHRADERHVAIRGAAVGGGGRRRHGGPGGERCRERQLAG